MEDEVTGSLFKEREYKENEHWWLAARKFSVSKIAIALSDFTILIWFVLMMSHVINIFTNPTLPVFSVLITSASILYVLFMAHKGGSSD
jgi:hypothetical protein